MSAVPTIVRLRWALTVAALRGSVWQKVALAAGILLAVAIAAGVGWMSWFVGIFPSCGAVGSGAAVSGAVASGVTDCGAGDMITFPAIRAVLLPAACLLGLMWAIVPLTYTGDGSSLNPRRFALFGLPDRAVALGTLLSGMTGIPALTLLACLCLTSLMYCAAGPLPVVGAIVGAALAMMAFVAVSKTALALAGSLVRSRRGQATLYLTLVLIIVLVAEAPSMLLDSGALRSMSASMGRTGAARLADVLAWTPFGAPFQIPHDLMGAAAGGSGPHWGLAAARVLVALATVALCLGLIVWSIRHDRLTAGRGNAAVRARGLGAFAWMPATPSGAISARMLVYWRRDPRYLVGLLLPVVVFAVLMVRGWNHPEMMWTAPLTIAWVMPILDSNALAYDGRAFAMQASAGVRGLDDRVGRVRVSATLGLVFVLLSATACMAMNGGVAMPLASDEVSSGGDAVMGMLGDAAQSAGDGADGLTAGSPVVAAAFTGGAVAVLLCGIGLAQVLSCVLMYPVATADKPFSSPQGRAAAQGFFPLVQMFGVYVCCAPTIVAFVAVLLTGRMGALWVVGLVGLLNGVAGLVLGVWLGGRLLDARIPAILRTLDRFASLSR